MKYYTVTTPNGRQPAPAICNALNELATRAVRHMEDKQLAALLRAHLVQERKTLDMLKTGMCTAPTIADQEQHINAIELVLAYLIA